MSVVGTDMLLMFSVSAAAGDTTAGTAATSLGDQVSTTQVTTASMDNLFDDVTSSEASSGDTEYRCVFVKNNHATDTAFNVQLIVQSEIALGGSITVAVDNIGVTAKGSASAQALAVANENTAPSGGAGVGTYGSSANAAASIPAGSVQGFWVKRVVGASTAALALDGGVLRIGGDG